MPLTILAREQWLSDQHLRKDTSHTPHVQRQVVTLPEEHDFRGPVVTRGDVASVRHIRVSDAGQAKVADLQITGFVHQDVARLEVSVNNASGVDVLETKYKNKIKSQ